MNLIRKIIRAVSRPSVREIVSCENITLRLMGMRGTSEYVITGGTEASLTLYRLRNQNGADMRIPEKTVSCDMATILALLDSCGVSRWDGFHGAHPRNVSDGVMFTFTAVVNGGVTIRADGSANYPRGYHDFIRALNRMLA